VALTPTIYRASIHLSHVDRGCYEHLQATVARHPSETAERLVARLLAYALCYEPDLVFTRGIAAGDEPDLWRKGGDGRVELWLEVGLPDADRLLKAARHASRAFLRASGSGRWRWESVHLARLAAVPNLCVLGLDYDFVQQVAALLQRSIEWSVTVTDGTLYLNVGNTTLETTIEILAAGADAD
jgi:uncharacterized protein YaeQ